MEVQGARFRVSGGILHQGRETSATESSLTGRGTAERAKPHPDSEVEFWHVGNLTACGTSPSQGEV